MLDNPLRVYDDIVEAMGQTPLVKLHKVTKDHGIKCQIWVKCEFMSSGGSSKDRIGRSMVLEAEKRGRIKPGDTIVESTSGNTGIGVVLTAIVRGYKSVITIPDKMSNEKIDLLRALGAKVIVTPTDLSLDHPDSYYSVAKRIGEQPGHYFIDQYCNPDNPAAHVKTTGPEIWEQMEGKLDYFFISLGTTGTLVGSSRYLKEKDPNIKFIAIDPMGSIIARPVEINGNAPRPYKMEGIGQPKVPKVMEYTNVHEFQKTEDKESFCMARELIEKEALLVGGSCGAVVIGTFNYLKAHGLADNENLRCVIFLPDGTRNYMTKLLSDNWMVGNGFFDPERLRNPEHPLANKTLQDLKNIQPIPYYDARLTVNDCFDLFKKGHHMIPIRNAGNIAGVVTKNSLAKTVADKKLHGMSSASHCTQRDYLKVPADVSLDIVANLLKTEVAVLLINYAEDHKIRSIYVLSQDQVLENMHETIKEII
jgi:cystathionine beta-synthase